MAALGSRDVILHVYDLHDCNSWLRGVALGVYHTGVEVGGKEYSFSEQGIVKCDPKRAPKPAVFRESIVLGECQEGGGDSHYISRGSHARHSPGGGATRHNISPIPRRTPWLRQRSQRRRPLAEGRGLRAGGV